MATNNATNTSSPIAITQGGTDATSMATEYGIVYYNGTNLVTSAIGTSSQVFTSNGSSAPTFQAAAPGNLILVADSTVTSNVTSVEFTSLSGSYNTYYLVFTSVVPQTSTAVLHLNITANGSFTDITSGFASGFWSLPYNSTTITNANSTSTMIISGPLVSTGQLLSGVITCFNVTSGGVFSMSGEGVFDGSTAGTGTRMWYTTYNAADKVLTGFQFIMSSGDISGGIFSVYGVLE